MSSKFLDPKNDLAFKRIFGTESNKPILIHFLNDIFGRTTDPIEKVTFLSPFQIREIEAERVSIVDVLCEDTFGNRFIIEMQVAKETSFVKRAQYYAAKAYIEQREKGINYPDLKEVTFLCIAGFELFPEKVDYLSHHVMLDKKTLEQDLKDFSFSFLELPKFKKGMDELVTMTEKWAYFFKHATQTQEKEVSKLAGSDLIIAKAYGQLDRFGWSAEELHLYDRVEMKKASEQGMLHAAREDGIAEGIAMSEIKVQAAQAKVQAAQAEVQVAQAQAQEANAKVRGIAKAMKYKNQPVSEIQALTGLSLEEIKTL